MKVRRSVLRSLPSPGPCDQCLPKSDSRFAKREGAPPLGKPVLVMRENTDRPEAAEACTVKLVDTDPRKITGEAVRLLDEQEYQRTSRIHNRYGDGHASECITGAIEVYFWHLSSCSATLRDLRDQL
jgi:UDP-N-acetylglucosamine 2-epimerase